MNRSRSVPIKGMDGKLTLDAQMLIKWVGIPLETLPDADTMEVWQDSYVTIVKVLNGKIVIMVLIF